MKTNIWNISHASLDMTDYPLIGGSFHTKKLCSKLFSREVEFYWHKQQYRVFVQPFGGLRGNVHGSSIWLVGKRVVDFL